MQKFLFLTAMLVGFFPINAHAQENSLLDYEFWETATIEDVTKALDQGADVNTRNQSGHTPLNVALNVLNRNENPDLDVVALLLDEGADIETRDNDGWTPLHSALVWSENPDFVELLLDKGADASEIELHLAARFGTPETIARLLDVGRDVNGGKDGWTPLHVAAAFNEAKVVALLLDRGADIEARSDYGWTPLHSAVEWSKTLEVVALLLDRGADIDIRKQGGYAPLHNAVSDSNLDLVTLLLDRGAHINLMLGPSIETRLYIMQQGRARHQS